MKLPVSVFIITQDEEANIARVLDSVSAFDEVIVVDSGSTDMTLEIAKSKKANIFHQDWLGYARQKQYAMDLCKNDWVLNLDADEALVPEHIELIDKIIHSNHYNSVRFLRNDMFINKPIPAFCKLPNNIRLYRKSKAKFNPSQQVHESAVVDGKETLIKTPFIHYGYNDLKTLVEKNNTYSSLRARDKFNNNKKPSLIKLLLIFPFEFLRKYLLQRYFLFGYRGIFLSMINANYAFLKEAKLFELYMRKKK